MRRLESRVVAVTLESDCFQGATRRVGAGGGKPLGDIVGDTQRNFLLLKSNTEHYGRDFADVILPSMRSATPCSTAMIYDEKTRK